VTLRLDFEYRSKVRFGISEDVSMNEHQKRLKIGLTVNEEITNHLRLALVSCSVEVYQS